MRIAFLGTPDFAAASLQALMDSEEHEVVACVSQPDRPAGRGNRLRTPPVAALAKRAGVPLLQPDRVGTRAFREWLASHEPDIGIVAAFGHILGPRLLKVPSRGFINVHASLLPRWRGAAPIQAALLAGDATSGVSIMQVDEGLDTGAVWLSRAVELAADETGETLHDALAELGAAALLDALRGIEAGELTLAPQPDAGATYAHKLSKQDADLDWSEPAEALERRVRAMHPWPGTRTALGDERLRVHPPAQVLGDAPAAALAPAGTIVAIQPAGLDVATGDGTLRLTVLQRPGKRALPVAGLLAGWPLAVGARFG